MLNQPSLKGGSSGSSEGKTRMQTKKTLQNANTIRNRVRDHHFKFWK